MDNQPAPSSKSSLPFVIIGVIVALLVGLSYFAYQSSTSPSPATPEEAADTPGESRATSTIIFTDDGFAPSDYTVKANQPVTVTNNSSMDLEFSSNNHPTHHEQSELNMSVLRPGESGTFTPTKPGTWGFHDHLHDEFVGKLVVE